jgi:hypothetical protein
VKNNGNSVGEYGTVGPEDKGQENAVKYINSVLEQGVGGGGGRLDLR